MTSDELPLSTHTHPPTRTHTHTISLYFPTMSVIWHTDMLYHGVTGCNWCTTGCFSARCSIIEPSCSRRAICCSWHVKSRQIIHFSAFHCTSKSTFQMLQRAAEGCFMDAPNAILQNLSSTIIIYCTRCEITGQKGVLLSYKSHRFAFYTIFFLFHPFYHIRLNHLFLHTLLFEFAVNGLCTAQENF